MTTSPPTSPATSQPIRRYARCGAALLVAGTLLALGPVGPSAAAGSQTVTAQLAYTCDGKSSAGVNQTTASIQLQLAVPTSVAPGEDVALSGTLKMQFGEEVRQLANTLGQTSVDAYSTTLSTYRTVGSAAPAAYFANRWQTGPTPIGNPLEVSAPLVFPTFTVPADATGELKLQLPQNGTTPNTATSNPASVAFAAIFHSEGPGGSFNTALSCYLTSPNAAVIASIPITGAAGAPGAAGAAGTGGGKSKPAAGSAKATSPVTTAQSTAAPVAPAAPGTQAAPAPAAPVASGGGGGGGGGGSGSGGGAGGDPGGAAASADQTSAAGAAVPVAADGSAQQPVQSTTLEPTAAPADDGLYLSPQLIVLAGFALCLVCGGYALLTTARLRAVQRTLDD